MISSPSPPSCWYDNNNDNNNIDDNNDNDNDKKKKNVTVPADNKDTMQESEKLVKYADLTREKKNVVEYKSVNCTNHSRSTQNNSLESREKNGGSKNLHKNRDPDFAEIVKNT